MYTFFGEGDKVLVNLEYARMSFIKTEANVVSFPPIYLESKQKLKQFGQVLNEVEKQEKMRLEGILKREEMAQVEAQAAEVWKAVCSAVEAIFQFIWRLILRNILSRSNPISRQVHFRRVLPLSILARYTRLDLKPPQLRSTVSICPSVLS